MHTKQRPKRKAERIQLAVWVTPEVKATLDDIKDREGLPLNRQVEHAIKLWARTREASV